LTKELVKRPDADRAVFKNRTVENGRSGRETSFHRLRQISGWRLVIEQKRLEILRSNRYSRRLVPGQTMKYELFTRVALKADLPKHALRSGDVATVVEHYSGRPGQEPGYSLEVFNAVGETVAVITVPESAIEPLRADEVLSVRSLTAA
jgi:hypothetical protein